MAELHASQAAPAIVPMKANLAGYADLGLAKPYIFSGDATDRDMAVNCLSAAAWYEAGNDDKGQRAVIQVVLNRLKHPSFPKSVCGVVFQGSERSTGCQFTFTCDGSLRRRVPSETSWRQAKVRALEALNGAVDADVRQATHYHADYVSPWWSPKLVQLNKVGAHIFYRWPGSQGLLSGRPVARLAGDLALEERVFGRGRPGLAPPSGSAPVDGQNKDAAGLVGVANPAPVPASNPGALFLPVDVTGPTGRWAVQAMDRCARRTNCLVVSYGGSEVDAGALAEAFAGHERPLFLFVRDASSGMDIALWDCARVARAKSDQCLPSGRQELLSLMKPRMI